MARPNFMRGFLGPVPQDPNGVLVDQAIDLMSADKPLPLTLLADLLSKGIDVDELDRVYRV